MIVLYSFSFCAQSYRGNVTSGLNTYYNYVHIYYNHVTNLPQHDANRLNQFAFTEERTFCETFEKKQRVRKKYQSEMSDYKLFLVTLRMNPP